MRTSPYRSRSADVSLQRIYLTFIMSQMQPLRISVLLASIFLAGSIVCAQAPNRIVQGVDTTAVRALPNHLPQWANSSNDAGSVPANRMLDPMTVVLSRSPQQQLAFERFLADQQNPASPNYHHWLTPAEVGKRFGLSAQDIGAVTGWLQSEGLRVNWVSPSRIFIGFGGAAADIDRAFQTELHYYRVNGVERMSVSSNPMIPEALVPAITAISGLYTVDEQPFNHITAVRSDSPQATTSNGNHYIAPVDFATIYDIPLGLNAPGETIGIVARSRTDFADFQNFMSMTGSTFSLPTEVVPTAFGGVDPGPALTSPPAAGVSTGDQSEATLDVLRSGSVAPRANLLLVVASKASGGIEVDAQYLVQTTPVPAQVMTISFGACESSAGPAGVDLWNALFQQAAAEGISSFVSSGDAGASGCDANFATPPASPSPNSPNYICSSSYVTCVGGTEFNDASDGAVYWSQTNGPDLNSAYTYIPEGGWNEPLNASSGTQAASSGGGVSTVIATPRWQTGTGVPAARSGRYTPDIAFSASCHDGYFGCFAAGGGSCVSAANGSYYFIGFCGTSAAAPGMAGIAAILDQEKGAPQGNLNPGLYLTSASSPAAFHDVTVATSGVTSCEINTPSMCNNSIPSSTALTGGQTGFLVGTGYDEVTGLGSLDVGQFLEYYAATITPTITATPSAISITPFQALTVTVSVSGGAGNSTPTGSITLTSGTYATEATTLSGGSAKIDIPAGSLSAGSDILTVKYTPDAASSSTYGAATVSTSVNVTLIVPTLTVTPSSASITTAQPLTVTVAVAGGSGNPTPTGTINLQGVGYFSGAVAVTAGSAAIDIPAGLLTAGNNTLNAYYTPDSQSSPIYSNAAGQTYVKVTATAPYTPTVTVTPSLSTDAQAEPLPVTIAVAGTAGNPTPTGSVTLISGSYSSAATTLTKGTASITIPAESLPVGYDSLTAIYAPDSASSAVYNNASGSNSVSILNPAKSIPVVTITPASSGITTAETLSVWIAVSGANGYPITTGSVTLTSGAYTSAATTLSANSATIIIPAGSLATGTDTLTANYTPDAESSAIFFSASNTSSVTVTTPAPPSFTIGGTPVILVPGATTGNTSTITVTPSGGFTGAVTLTASITSGPSGAEDAPTLSFGSTSPASITGASAGIATLTISTTAATSAALVHAKPFGVPWFAAGGAAFACVLLLGVPAQRRRWRSMLAMVALLATLASGALACGGGGSGTIGTGNPGTTAGTYTVTVTGISGTNSETGKFTLTVQ